MDSKIRTIVSIGLMGALTLSAFAQKSRNAIKHRAGYRCEITGREDLPMDCIHYNHNKGSKYYNSPDNGFYGSIIVHLAHHTLYRDYPREIGLSYAENDWAINTLRKRCLDAYAGTEDQMDGDYQVAEAQLSSYLSLLKEG